MIQKIDYPSLCFELTTSPLSEILDEFDVVYGANITTANLDAYSVGLSVIVHLSEDKLNLSPLRGMEDVKFVSSSKELESVLEARESEDINKREPYFWLDEGLPKWSALLEEYGN